MSDGRHGLSQCIRQEETAQPLAQRQSGAPKQNACCMTQEFRDHFCRTRARGSGRHKAACQERHRKITSRVLCWAGRRTRAGGQPRSAHEALHALCPFRPEVGWPLVVSAPFGALCAAPNQLLAFAVLHTRAAGPRYGERHRARLQVRAGKGGESDGSTLADTPRVVERQQSLTRQCSGRQVGTARDSWEEPVKEATAGKWLANGHVTLEPQAVVTEIDQELATERDSAAQRLADLQRLADERAARIAALQWQIVASRGQQQQHEARAADLEQQLAGERRNRSRQLAEMQRYAAEQAAKIAALEALLAARHSEGQGAEQAAGAAELEQQLTDAQQLAAEQAARVAELEQQLAEEQQAAANLITDAQQEAAEHATKVALLEGQLVRLPCWEPPVPPKFGFNILCRSGASDRLQFCVRPAGWTGPAVRPWQPVVAGAPSPTVNMILGWKQAICGMCLGGRS